MLKYIAKRILLLIPVLLGVSIIIFAIMRVFSPDPAGIVLGQHATEQSMEEWREANGLNEPIVTQYVHYMKGIFTGTLGNLIILKNQLLMRFSRVFQQLLS